MGCIADNVAWHYKSVGTSTLYPTMLCSHAQLQLTLIMLTIIIIPTLLPGKHHSLQSSRSGYSSVYSLYIYI